MHAEDLPNPDPNQEQEENPQQLPMESVGQENSPIVDKEDDSPQATSDSHTQTSSQPPTPELIRSEAELKQSIANLENTYQRLQAQINSTQANIGQLVEESLTELEQRKQTLLLSIEQLERRQDRIRKEMRTTFAGASQDLAVRVQGFKDYLTGSLQDLVIAAEQLELVPETPPPAEPEWTPPRDNRPPEREASNPQFSQSQFQETSSKIRRFIDRYRTKPDYYGPPWQLRRTFEPIHAERVSAWFFEQGGRGALRAMGSRLQNILVASAVISIMNELYGDRLRVLVLANSPERLGEWRRGLQDCLGIGRPDFGPDRGVILFETADAIAQKAERIVRAKEIPLIILDDSEESISLALLQYPYWLAFAPDPKAMRRDSYYDDF